MISRKCHSSKLHILLTILKGNKACFYRKSDILKPVFVNTERQIIERQEGGLLFKEMNFSQTQMQYLPRQNNLCTLHKFKQSIFCKISYACLEKTKLWRCLLMGLNGSTMIEAVSLYPMLVHFKGPLSI